MSLIEYDIQRVLGSGSHGQVYLGRNTRDGKLYAIKKMILKDTETPKLALQEARSLLDIQHSNIITYKESFLDHLGQLNIIMKFAPGGDLSCEIEKRKLVNNFIREREVMTWSLQIFMALKYLHERGIVHKDLKPQNIFLDKAGIVKVGDLGIAKVMENKMTGYVGTPHYMSPELFANKPFTHKSDVWAVGCCMYELVTLRRAFDAEEMIELELKIQRGKTQRMPFLYSKCLRDLIEEMLRKHSKNRPSIRRIFQNEYVKSRIKRVLDNLTLRKQENEEYKAGRRNAVTRQTHIPDTSIQNEDTFDIHDTSIEEEVRVKKSQSQLMPKSSTISRYRALQHKDSLLVCNDGLGDEQTSTISDDDTITPLLHRRPYNPRNYSDITSSLATENVKPSHPTRFGRDSGYSTENVTAHSIPLERSQVPLDSSTRFYPIATLGLSETVDSQEKATSKNGLIAISSSSHFPRLPRSQQGISNMGANDCHHKSIRE